MKNRTFNLLIKSYGCVDREPELQRKKQKSLTIFSAHGRVQASVGFVGVSEWSLSAYVTKVPTVEFSRLDLDATRQGCIEVASSTLGSPATFLVDGSSSEISGCSSSLGST